jgi:hypothetical protein
MNIAVNKQFSAVRSSAVRLTTAAAAVIAIVTAAGCSDATDSAADVSTADVSTAPSVAISTDPVSEIATSSATGPVTAIETSTTTSTETVVTTVDDAAPCQSAGASVIAGGAISQIPPPVPGALWVSEESNFDGCADFTYVALATEGGTVSSPHQLLFFHRDEFLGTGTACNLPYQQITGATDDQVDVSYRYIVGDEANADPQGQVSVSYRWTGSGVEMIGELPAAMTGGRC